MTDPPTRRHTHHEAALAHAHRLASDTAKPAVVLVRFGSAFNGQEDFPVEWAAASAYDELPEGWVLDSTVSVTGLVRRERA